MPNGKLVAVPESELTVNKTLPAKATMVVGKGEKITTITEAARLAKDGEIIEILTGNYHGQPAIWSQNNLVIRDSWFWRATSHVG